MSRSRRHSPYIPVTTADSEKRDKRFANRRLRRINRIRTAMGLEPLKLREVSNVWLFDKDGRQGVDPDSKWMRK